MLEVSDFLVRAYGIEIRVDELVVRGKTALLGRNGSGKTTFVRAVVGILRNERGRVIVDGVDVTDLPTERRPIAYLPQERVVLPFRPAEQLRYFARLHGTDFRWVVENLGLDGLLAKSGLSGGERQLLNIATALLKGPKVLILDEPTQALDFPNKVMVLRTLRRLDVPTVFVTHDPLEAYYLCDELVVMESGRIKGPVRNEMREWAEEALENTLKLYTDMIGVEV
ncbi:MAG: ABC transporter ATP-binding protein [Nitrososphaerota archaeon]